MKIGISLALFLSLFCIPSTVLSFSVNGAKLPAEWTLLVYVNADNNLHEAGLNDLEEMESIGSTPSVNILVQFDGKHKNDTRRYYVGKGDSVEVEDFSELGGEVDMGDSVSLVDFIIWGIENYPAKKYFVDVWNHGNGALNSAKFKNYVKAISFDETSGTYISTPELGIVFETVKDLLGRKIDVYGSDACLMAMLEVAYELKDNVDYVIGSQAVEPGDGWPYDDLLAMLIQKPEIEGAELSSSLVEYFNASYSAGGSQGRDNVTLSAVSTEHIDVLVNNMNDFIYELMDLYDYSPEKVREAAAQAASFTYASHRDLGNFLEGLKNQTTRGTGFLSSINRVIEHYYTAILSAANTGGIYQNSTGLAIWFPLNLDTFSYNKNEYKTLKFARSSLWYDFLEKYHDMQPKVVAMQ